MQTDNSHIGGKKSSKRARSSSLEKAGARFDRAGQPLPKRERSEFSELSCPVRQYDSSTAQTIAGVKLQVNNRGVGGSMVQTAAQDFLVTSTVGHSRKVVAEARTAENYAQFFQRQMQIDATPLSRYYAAWLELCSPLPPCLDRTLSHGLSLVFRDLPPPYGGVKKTVLRNEEGSLLLHQEIQGLLQKGVISLVPTALEREGCYSTYFLVPKKTGGHRAVLNLKYLNSFIREELTFKMLTTKSLLELVRPGDWATSLDLKDAFFHVPVLQSHRKYLRFHFKGQSYQYNVMPFGYTLAPLVFTRLLEKALVPLRREGNRIYAYIDDLLNLGGTPQEVRNITLSLAHHLLALGFSINWEKSAPDPTQRPVYLGVQLDTSLMKATLSEARRINLMHLLHRFRTIPGHSYHECQVMVGHLVSATHLIPLGMLYARPIMRWFSRLRMHPRRDKGKHIVVPPRLHPHMNQWLYALGNGLSVPMGPPPQNYATVFTDACPEGWGGVYRTFSVRGKWVVGEKRHINLLELRTVLLVLKHFVWAVQGRHVLIRSDNKTAVAHINKQGGIHSVALMDQSRELWLWAHQHLLSLRALYIKGVENKGADLLSRGGPREADWQLNPVLAHQLWVRFGKPAVDLFASRENTQCRTWYSLTRETYPCLGVDALSAEHWPRGLLYAFPPQSLILPLLERVRREKRALILVAPDSPKAWWYPRMKDMQVSPPWMIPDVRDALRQAVGLGTVFSRPKFGTTPLQAWLLRGKNC